VTWTVRIAPEAEAELEASARWYDENAGLRDHFLDEIGAALGAIAEAPLRYPIWRTGAAFRKCVVRRVPYVIYYRVLSNYVEIAAFAHMSRQPGYWVGR
jgi:plasmid stabilization system protein ParE